MVAPLFVCQLVICNRQWRPRETTAYRTYMAIGPATFFSHGQKRDYLSRASQRARAGPKNYKNWLTSVEDITSQSTIILDTEYSITDKTISGVHVFPGSAETLVRRGGIANVM